MLLKNLSVLLFVLVAILVQPKIPLANADEKSAPYVIGYIDHPRIHEFYKPLIKEAYKQIGITASFEKVGVKRGLRLLNEGRTDADVIRYDVVTTDHANIIAIEPQLSRGASFLLCKKSVKCHADIVNDPLAGIAVTSRFYQNFNRQSEPFSANFYEFDDFYHILHLVNTKRFDYAIAPSDFSELTLFDDYDLTYIPLIEHKLVHVIHKKHLHLKEKLSVAIATQLEKHQLRHANEK
ncbi:hypothetical protein [Alteromonas sp. P256]|uniref:hypothetical protein n=1 Tax=Alteromonas sp. P256 TaxID=3117399 RepID=UPI003F68B33E